MQTEDDCSLHYYLRFHNRLNPRIPISITYLGIRCAIVSTERHGMGDTFPDQEERLALAERVSLPYNRTNIFMSVLATRKYHDMGVHTSTLGVYASTLGVHTSTLGYIG